MKTKCSYVVVGSWNGKRTLGRIEGQRGDNGAAHGFINCAKLCHAIGNVDTKGQK